MRLTVNPDRCDLCGACVTACPADMVRERDGRLKIGHVRCLECGHCVALCPHRAIVVEEPPPGGDFAPRGAEEVTPAALAALLLRRRTIRRYAPRPVPRELLEQMLDAARWVPTAANCQCQQYTVITDSALRDRLTAAVVAFYRAYSEALQDREPSAARLAALGLDPQFGMQPHMLVAVPAFLKHADAGRDRLFFSAPAVVVVHAAEDEVLPAAACAFAALALVFMAETLGLGTCLTAYASEALAALPALRAELGLPDHHRVHFVLTVGYPAEQYQLVPPRGPARVTWR